MTGEQLDRPKMSDVMPAMLNHQGIWRGVYTHLDTDSAIIDQHSAQVECEFPETGQFAYIQRNLFTWPDGREQRAVLPGVLRDGKLWWNTDSFSGCAWETDFNVILLKLDRKDEPGASFFETIVMGGTGTDRARVWQWFRDGKLYKRTLCNEYRVLPDG